MSSERGTDTDAPVERRLLPATAEVLGDGQLAIGGCDVVALAAEHGTPAFLYDEAHLRARCAEAVRAFGEGVAYATKAFLCTAMARLVQENLRQIIDAIGERNIEGAIAVWRSDAAIDDLYNALFRELVTYMMEDARNITPCTHLLFIAKNLERIGDHATNIAEMLHYSVTGETLPDVRPKGDNSPYAVVRLRD